LIEFFVWFLRIKQTVSDTPPVQHLPVLLIVVAVQADDVHPIKNVHEEALYSVQGDSCCGNARRELHGNSVL